MIVIIPRYNLTKFWNLDKTVQIRFNYTFLFLYKVKASILNESLD